MVALYNVVVAPGRSLTSRDVAALPDLAEEASIFESWALNCASPEVVKCALHVAAIVTESWNSAHPNSPAEILLACESVGG